MNERTVSHTVSAMLAGTEIRAESDIHEAEERLEETKQPSLTPCALAQRGDGQLEAENRLEKKGAKWEPVSAPAMPIQNVDEKEEHRHFIAAFGFPFNVLVAEPVPKTQRNKIPRPGQHVTKNGTSCH